MQVVLVMFRGEGERRSFSLTRDTTIIGRREDCDFRIPLGEISRKHCRLIKDGDELKIEDLGSSNGTYVNGVRVQETVLSPGDTVKLGSIVFVVQIDGVPSEEELSPAAAPADAALGSAVGMSTESALNPTAQSDAADAALDAEEPSHGANPTIDQGADDFIIDDSPAESDGEYDPMAVLEHDPEDSSAGEISEEMSEDILMDLESQDHKTKQ